MRSKACSEAHASIGMPLLPTARLEPALASKVCSAKRRVALETPRTGPLNPLVLPDPQHAAVVAGSTGTHVANILAKQADHSTPQRPGRTNWQSTGNRAAARYSLSSDERSKLPRVRVGSQSQPNTLAGHPAAARLQRP